MAENIVGAELTMSLDEAKILVMRGMKGEDGYSPTVTVTDITGGHRVTITDEDGDHAFDVMDGQGGGSVDSEFSQTSENPVQNKIITGALVQLEEYLDNLSNTKANRTELAPFEIPITQSGGTYSTTATAADILANADNCVLAQVGTGSVMWPSAYFVQGSTAQIVFSGTDSINGFIQNVTFTVTVNNGTVTLGYYRAEDELPTVSASDNGKVLGVVNGAWAVKAEDFVMLRADANGWVYNGETAITGSQINVLAGNDTPLLLWDEEDKRLFIYAGVENYDDALFIMPATDGNGAYVKIVAAASNASSWYERVVLPRVLSTDNGKILGVVNGAWTVTPPANALVIDFNSPYASAYDDAKAAMQGNREVYLKIEDNASNPTGCIYLRANAWNATHITFGGLSSAYLPGGYFILTYAHITSGTSNWFKWTTPFYFNPVLFQHLAPPYDNTATYSVGDYCTYGENSLNTSGVYRCTTAITTAEEWNSAHWTAVTVMGEIAAVDALPSVSASDNGKILKVVNGVWTAVAE